MPFLSIPADFAMTDTERADNGPRLVPVPPGDEHGPYSEPGDLSPIAEDARGMARQLTRIADALDLEIPTLKSAIAQARAIATHLLAVANASAGPRYALVQSPRDPIRPATNHGSHTANVVFGTEYTETGDTFMPDDLTYGPHSQDGAIPPALSDLLPTPPGRPDGTIFAYDGSPISTVTAAKFWRRVVRTTDHWVWRGMLSSKTGRPMVRMGRKLWYAHRIAYTLHTGRDIAGQYLKVTCGELNCVRPNHHVLSNPGDPRVTDGDGRSLTPEIPAALEKRQLDGTAASVFQARSLVTNAYRDPDGKQRYCRMGHAMSLQPSGRPTCRPCDRERQAASVLRKQQHEDARFQTRQASRELGQALLTAIDASERSGFNLVASTEPPPMSSEEYARAYAAGEVDFFGSPIPLADRASHKAAQTEAEDYSHLTLEELAMLPDLPD